MNRRAKGSGPAGGPPEVALEVRKSNVYGLGCFTLTPLPKGRSIAAYAGEVIRGKRKIRARIREQEAAGVIKVITLGEEVGIDGAAGGDATAHINHSCAPNAFMRIVSPEKVMFFALRDIEPGEEITIDYRDPNHPAPGECRCGAARCRSNRLRRPARGSA